jgi:type II secretory pathway pseudopilin PulG
MTLVEVMVSIAIFAVMASSLLAGFLFSLRLSENNLAQAYANSTAQSVVEQIVCVSPALLTSSTEAGVEIKVPVLNDSNYTTMPAFTLPWATDDTTYTTVLTSPQGVLADAAYVAASQTIRPERYLPIEFNLQRTIQSDLTSVHILLRYRWQIPDRRNADGTPIWLSGELRTIRSKALRF